MVQKELHRNTEQHEPGEHSGALDEQAEFGKIPKKELHRNIEQREPREPSGALDELGEYSGALDKQAVRYQRGNEKS